MVSENLLVVVNLTMLSAQCAIPFGATIPSKLKRHNELKHKENIDSVEMFEAKRVRYDVRGTFPALGFCLTSQPLLRASYEVSLIIAKAKAPHTAGEKLIDPSVVKMAQILLGRNEVKRIVSVPLSDNTVNNRIADIANDVLSQLIGQIQDSPCRISFLLLSFKVSSQVFG